jgi:hypothetical protein
MKKTWPLFLFSDGIIYLSLLFLSLIFLEVRSQLYLVDFSLKRAILDLIKRVKILGVKLIDYGSIIVLGVKLGYSRHSPQ